MRFHDNVKYLGQANYCACCKYYHLTVVLLIKTFVPFVLILFGNSDFCCTGFGVADQLLCDGAGKHCVSFGILQWPERGEIPTAERALFARIKSVIKSEETLSHC